MPTADFQLSTLPRQARDGEQSRTDSTQDSKPKAQSPKKKRSSLPLDTASFLAEIKPEQRHYIEAFQAIPPATQVEIPLEAISPSPLQPRKFIDQEKLRELAASIAEVGVLEPILVRPIPESAAPSPDTKAEYQIVIGERRWRAAQEAGLHGIPCLIRQLSDDEAFLIALSENIQRDDLTALEEAEAYQHLIQTGAVPNQAELARRLGVTRARISQKIKIIHLDHHSKQEMLLHPRQITEHHAQQLLRIPSLDLRHQALELILETGISARSLHRRLRQLSHYPLSADPAAIYQISHRGFSLRIALDTVDRELAAKELSDAISRLQSLTPQPPATEPLDTPLPGL